MHLRMRNGKEKKLKKILIIVVLIAAVFVFSFIGLETVKRSNVTNYQIKTNNLTCTDNDQINQYLKTLTINYFSYKEDKFSQNLKKKFFCIGMVKTHLSYPDRLVLEIWGRKPMFAAMQVSTSLELGPVVALPDVMDIATGSTIEATPVKTLNQILSNLKQSSESGVFLVDKEGIVFEQISGNVIFPMLKILGIKIETGSKIPDGVVEKAGVILNKLKEIEAPTDNIIIIGDRLVVDSKPRIVFSLNKRIDYQTASLQLILSQAKINLDSSDKVGNNIESIDLRFDKPVVVYNKNNK